jgi:pimeloyl-ACP methyl ester carboxylesterase
MTQTEQLCTPAPARRERRRQQAGLAAVRATIDAATLVSPGLGGRLALQLWRRPGRPGPVRPEERAVHDAASTSSVEHLGRVATYAWGDGARPVLLVHGWGGRSSRFATLVTALLARGYSPVAYDAWGHGATSGPVRSILEHQVVIDRLAERHGPFEGVVAHSFGVPVSQYAVRNGLAADRMVAIGGMADFGYLVDGFCAGLGVRARVYWALRRAIERTYFDGDDGIWERFSTGPLPGTTVLVVHDADDAVVARRQADLMLDALGSATMLETTGLGHSRILRDPAVVAATVDFLSGGTR